MYTIVKSWPKDATLTGRSTPAASHTSGFEPCVGEFPVVGKKIPLTGAVRVQGFSRPESRLLPLNEIRLGPSYPTRSSFHSEIMNL